MNASHLLDEHELPFTEDEIYRAFCLLGIEDARDGVRTVAECVRGQYEGGWPISDRVFAALALLSADVRDRVDAFVRPGGERGRRGW